MALSAFGVEDGRFSKADSRKERVGLAAAVGGVGGAGGMLAASKPQISRSNTLMRGAGKQRKLTFENLQAANRKDQAAAKAQRRATTLGRFGIPNGQAGRAAAHTADAAQLRSTVTPRLTRADTLTQQAKKLRRVVGLRGVAGAAAGAAATGTGAALLTRRRQS